MAEVATNNSRSTTSTPIKQQEQRANGSSPKTENAPTARTGSATPTPSTRTSRTKTQKDQRPHTSGIEGQRIKAKMRSQSVPKPFTNYGLYTSPTPNSSATKKVPMNKIKVGMSDSPNLKQVKSKIGSLNNSAHKPGGGDIKIETRKLEWKAEGKTVAKNVNYTPKGGDKKIESRKLDWKGESKVGSLQNATHKPGGGDKKICNEKLTWKSDSKVGSKDYLSHKPGGGQVKIVNQKIEVTGKSKVGSLDNVKHKAGGGDKKVYNDVDYLRQMSEKSNASSTSRSSSRRQSANHLNSSPEPACLYNNNNNNEDPKSEPYITQFKRKMTPEPPPLTTPSNLINLEI